MGDVANQYRTRGLIDVKKVANHGSLENSAAAPPAIDFKNVKPRVDTHWTNHPVRKPLTRTSSLKNPLVTGVAAATAAQAGPKLVKAKSIETAIVKEVKLVKRTKSPERQSTLKRQESGSIRYKVSTTKTDRISTQSSRSISIGKEIEKRAAIRTKSTEIKIAATSSGYIAEPPVIESRFPSYSNGFVEDVSLIVFYLSNAL